MHSSPTNTSSSVDKFAGWGFGIASFTFSISLGFLKPMCMCVQCTAYQGLLLLLHIIITRFVSHFNTPELCVRKWVILSFVYSKIPLLRPLYYDQSLYYSNKQYQIFLLKLCYYDPLYYGYPPVKAIYLGPEGGLNRIILLYSTTQTTKATNSQVWVWVVNRT